MEDLCATCAELNQIPSLHHIVAANDASGSATLGALEVQPVATSVVRVLSNLRLVCQHGLEQNYEQLHVLWGYQHKEAFSNLRKDIAQELSRSARSFMTATRHENPISL